LGLFEKHDDLKVKICSSLALSICSDYKTSTKIDESDIKKISDIIISIVIPSNFGVVSSIYSLTKVFPKIIINFLLRCFDENVFSFNHPLVSDHISRFFSFADIILPIKSKIDPSDLLAWSLSLYLFKLILNESDEMACKDNDAVISDLLPWVSILPIETISEICKIHEDSDILSVRKIYLLKKLLQNILEKYSNENSNFNLVIKKLIEELALLKRIQRISDLNGSNIKNLLFAGIILFD